MAEQLEQKGKVDHLKANINFRLSLASGGDKNQNN
jgi:hypothetical protein